MKASISRALTGASWGAIALLVQLASAQTASAQNTTTPNTTAQDTSAPAAAPSTPADGDIVVTAQRTSSLASKTPVALTAISGAGLRNANVTNPTDLGNLVPNLSIVRNNGLQITIRGVTSSDNTEKGDPSAAFLLDGIYIARPQVQEVSFYDISRVEVLRGPQGTLYGRNTTAGVVGVITNKPTDHYEEAGSVTVGDYGTVQADGMINVPVNDRLALRFAGSYDRRDSYLYRDAGDSHTLNPFKDNLSGRIEALVHIGDNATLLLRGDYSRMRGNGSLNSVNGDRYFNLGDTSSTTGADPVNISNNYSSRQLRELGYALPADQYAHDNTWGGSAELNWVLGPLTMTYLGSFRQYNADEANVQYLGVSVNEHYQARFNQNSQELRFATNGNGPFKLQFGAYYFREYSHDALYALDFVPGVPYFGYPEGPTVNKTAAGFAQATYKLLPRLRLTAGLRYSQDNKSRQGLVALQQGPTFNPATDIGLLNFASLSAHRLTWRAGVDYDVDSRTLLYGVVSTGYKAGGFNDGCLAGTSALGITCNQAKPADQLYYKPETLTAYELGLKMHTRDNTFRFNASAFYYNYDNLQLTTVAEQFGTPTQLTLNAAKARVKGIETEATITPSPRNRFDLGFNYLDAYYASYNPSGAGTLPDYSGRPLDRSPSTVVSTGYTYTLPLGNAGSIEAGVRSRMSSSYVISLFNIPRQLVQPAYTRTDATITYNAPDKRYYLQAYVSNIENTIIVTAALYSGALTVTPGDPRTFGVRAGFHF